MSIISEGTIELEVGAYTKKIKQELEKNKENPQACKALREIGRFALSRFEWTTPAWATEYDELFKEPPEETTDTA